MPAQQPSKLAFNMMPNTLRTSSEEIANFEHTVYQFLEGHIDAERFMAFRLQHGVYGQRQEGVHMVRVKIPAGRLFSHQLLALANILSNYSETTQASVTTRQDIQLHFIKLKDTPNVLRLLSDANLTTREACGNTVRNITACTLSGVCPQQYTDITPYAEAVTHHFLRHPLTQHLPRKFKISFSACATDCAMGLMHDVGVIATYTNGTFGFRLLAGGGLGHKPRSAITVLEKLETEDLIPAIEAIISLHNRYSDRKRRAKARIKFLIEKFGADDFRRKFQEEFARTKLALTNIPAIDSQWSDTKANDHNFRDGAPRAIIPQRQHGLSLLPIHLPLGQISGEQLTTLHRVMSEYNLTELRTTSDQNLVLINTPSNANEAIINQLAKAKLETPTHGDNIVSCPGTATCRLGITASRSIARDIANPADLRIRISGCHNSCGQHHLADIGLHGEGNRVQGKLIPSYVIHLGGEGTANGQIAIKGPTVPAVRAAEAVTRISQAYKKENRSETFSMWAQAKPASDFDTLLQDLILVEPVSLKELTRDVGETESFRVLQLGGGECAGVAQDYVASSFSEALHERNYCSAFFLQQKPQNALECANQIVKLTASSILFLAGAKTGDELEQIQDIFSKVLAHHGELITSLSQICQHIDQLNKQFDAKLFNAMLDLLDQWINTAAHTCQEMDTQLNLAPTNLSAKNNENQEQLIELDLSSYECPLHYVKARNELRKLPSAQLVKLILEDEEAIRQVSLSLKKEGHTILENTPEGDFFALMVRRKN